MSAEVKTIRRSADETLKELTKAFQKGNYKGAVVLWIDGDNHSNGHMRIVGFDGPCDYFYIAGLLQWAAVDVLKDIS